jgi:hypothetical protein
LKKVCFPPTRANPAAPVEVGYGGISAQIRGSARRSLKGRDRTPDLADTYPTTGASVLPSRMIASGRRNPGLGGSQCRRSGADVGWYRRRRGCLCSADCGLDHAQQLRARRTGAGSREEDPMTPTAWQQVLPRCSSAKDAPQPIPEQGALREKLGSMGVRLGCLTPGMTAKSKISFPGFQCVGEGRIRS